MYFKVKQKITAILLGLITVMSVNAAEIWVSPNGNDANDGSKDTPLATVHMALRKARELRRVKDASIADGIQIIIVDGVYYFSEPLLIRPDDSGAENSPTTIKAAPGASPVFSGGIRLESWKKLKSPVAFLSAKANKNVWVTKVPYVGGQPINFRQMWINDTKAIRATNFSETGLNRILSVDKEKQELWIPTPKTKFKNINDLEFVIHQWWAIANLRVKSLEVKGDKTKLSFHQPESQIEFEHPWPAPFIDSKKEYNGNSAFFFTGASELLDEPGEWYLDQKTSTLYYWPRDGEKMKKSNVTVPVMETLVAVKGNLDNPVAHFSINNIVFKHTTWLRPSEKGHVPLQAGMYILEAYKLQQPGTPDKAGLENQAWVGRQPAAVTVTNAKNISISDCGFNHLAATGLDFVSGVANSEVLKNQFIDIGGTGIQAGFFGDESFEAHLPYNPKDKREVVHHITIADNLVEDATNEDWGCVGISVGAAHDINIEHNEIRDVNYSGICVGWFWTKTITVTKNNRIHANKIHHFAKQMYDVGGIYTLAAQPNTEISENYIYDLVDAPYAHMKHHHQYIYFDEGSSFIRAINNWTERDKFFSNSPGPGNEWDNNGPQVSEEIKESAGIRKH